VVSGTNCCKKIPKPPQNSPREQSKRPEDLSLGQIGPGKKLTKSIFFRSLGYPVSLKEEEKRATGCAIFSGVGSWRYDLGLNENVE
jgi:hypothetical protein